MSLVQALAITAAAFVTALSMDGGFDSMPYPYAISARAEAIMARQEARIAHMNALITERYILTDAPDTCGAKYGRL